MTNNNNENTQGNMEQNIEALYNTQFYRFELEIFSKPTQAMIRMYGLEKNPTPEQESMGRHLKMMIGKYSQSMEYSTKEDFIQEYSILFVQACRELEVLEPIEVLLQDNVKHKQRLAFIRTYITRAFVGVAHDTTEIVSTHEGQKYIDITVLSYDVFTNDEGKQTRFIDLLKEDQSLYSTNSTTPNHFISWVMSNYKDVLTKKQADVFEKLMECYQPLTDRRKETLELRADMFKDLDIASNQLLRMFKTIKKRCLDAYRKQFNGMTSHVTESSKKLHEVLNDYINQSNNTDWETASERQKALTNIITKNYDNETFEVLITKDLKVEEVKNIVRAYNGKELISHTVLRKIRQNMEKYIEIYTPIEIEANYPKFNYKENLYENISKLPTSGGRMTPEGILQYKDEQGNWLNFE